jgi:hypothetical protein
MMQPVADKSSTARRPAEEKAKLGARASQSARIAANSAPQETSSPLRFLRTAVKGCQG